jgi:isopentenyl phosphate kinase
MSGRGAVVKIGGSVLAPKADPTLRVDLQLLERLAGELAELAARPLVLVHGAGSYGHQIVSRTGLHHGLSDPASLLSMGETQRLQHVLNCQVADVLLRAGLPVMPLQASAVATLRDGAIERMDLTVLEGLVDRGLVPLLYGVPALDHVRGCSILSGDAIAPHIAERMRIARLVHLTDVDGVHTADPSVRPDAERVVRITPGNWERVRPLLAGSRAVDVTGGMAGKVEGLLDLAARGTISYIVSARIPGRVAAALADADVGTRICWEDE